MTRLLVVGLGNDLRGDDAAGLLAVRALAALCPPEVVVEEQSGDPATLAESLARHERVIVIDAVQCAEPTGTVVDLTGASSPPAAARSSSHGLGLAEALALARALGAAPEVRVIGIAGADFALGAQPAGDVVRAAGSVAARIWEESSCA